jgi:hypothetical protein
MRHAVSRFVPAVFHKSTAAGRIADTGTISNAIVAGFVGLA